MSNNNIVPFEFNGAQLRTVEVNGEPWFVAADVANILGVGRVQDSVRYLDDDEKGKCPVDTPSGTQDMTTISESGLYSLILRSRKPEAKAFKRWVTREVLPQIRKTGSYTAPVSQELEDARIIQQAIQISYRRTQELEAKVAEDAPKVEYVDTFCADEDTLKFRTVASDLGISEAELRSILIHKGWIYKETSRRYSESKGRVVDRNRYAEYSHKKPYFYRRMDHDAPRFKGEVMWTLKITPAGAAAISRLVGKGALV